jgi:hypothetical protein
MLGDADVVEDDEDEEDEDEEDSEQLELPSLSSDELLLSLLVLLAFADTPDAAEQVAAPLTSKLGEDPWADSAPLGTRALLCIAP